MTQQEPKSQRSDRSVAELVRQRSDETCPARAYAFAERGAALGRGRRVPGTTDIDDPCRASHPRPPGHAGLAARQRIRRGFAASGRVFLGEPDRGRPWVVRQAQLARGQAGDADVDAPTP